MFSFKNINSDTKFFVVILIAIFLVSVTVGMLMPKDKHLVMCRDNYSKCINKDMDACRVYESLCKSH